MSLQPLAENAVRHGVSRRVATGRITLSVQRLHDQLEICIADNGPGPVANSHPAKTEGVGLKNTRTRLRQLYGEAGSLTFVPAIPCGAIVTLYIPFRTMNAAEVPQIELDEV